MSLTKLFFAGLLSWALPLSAAGFDHRHAAWNALLSRHVLSVNDGAITQLRYAGMAAQRAELTAYLKQLEAVTPAQYAGWTREQKLAFLINAYNAWTVELVLTKYPKLKSIRELGSLLRSPWKQDFIPLLGRTLSLDEIEHGLIRKRGDFDDPRIHFAVNCASIGCPALRAETFVGARLEAQLEDASTRFLRDRSRNRYDAAKDTVYVSKIFDWYGEDFELGHRGFTSLKVFFAAKAHALADGKDAQAKLRSQSFRVQFTDYDWALNDAR